MMQDILNSKKLTQKKFHILIIPSWYYTSNKPYQGIFFRNQAHALKRIGHKIGVLYPSFVPIYEAFRSKCFFPKNIVESDSGIPTFRYDGFTWLPILPHGKAFLFKRKGYQLFKNYISIFGKPDIIHAHGAIYAGALAAFIKKKYSIPLIITEHASDIALGNIRKWQLAHLCDAYRAADLKIAVSPQLGSKLQNMYRDWSTDWYFLPNMIDKQFIKKTAKKFEKSFDQPFIFLNIGNLFKIKRHDILLRAFSNAFEQNHNVNLQIGGDGPLKNRLIRLSEKLGVSKRVIFLGGLNNDEVIWSLQNCNVFVSSSSYETFGVALIEALACGKPVVAVKSGGPEFIVNKDNGLLVPSENIDFLSKALVEIKDKYTKYNPELIRKDCIKRFNENTIMHKLSNLFEKALN
jgi:glycosyltransferase involved in cell wall biosynthesis